MKSPLADRPPSLRSITHAAEMTPLAIGDLSEFFNPFLDHFVKEALRCEGEVRVSVDGGRIRGIFLYHDVEREASIFTRERAVAEELFRIRDRLAVFSDFELAPGSEVYHIYAADHPTWNGAHRFAHPVRVATPPDREPVASLMKEVYGRVDERWLSTSPQGREECFVVDGANEIAGVAWASVVNGHGRLHSLSVRPRYRRTGVATDLWYARMGWTRGAGAGRVLTEISDHNLPSRTIAEAGGMRPIGRIFLSRRP